MDPQFALAHFHLGAVLLEKGRADEAIAEFRAAGAAGPMSTVSIARALAAAGHREQAESTLQQLLAQSKEQFVPPYSLVLLYAALDDQERAIDWIDHGLERVGGGPWFLEVNPPFDRLQSNPRYQAILRRVGLVPRARSHEVHGGECLSCSSCPSWPGFGSSCPSWPHFRSAADEDDDVSAANCDGEVTGSPPRQERPTYHGMKFRPSGKAPRWVPRRTGLVPGGSSGLADCVTHSVPPGIPESPWHPPP